MPNDGKDLSPLEQTKASLIRMQQFDPKQLPRVKDLGTKMNFEDVVEPSTRLCALYRQLPVDALQWFSETMLDKVRDQANADFNRFEEILGFEVTVHDAPHARKRLINQVRTAYDTAFESLYELIAYGVSRVTDIGDVENKARAMLQTVGDETKRLERQMQQRAEEADRVLADIRKVAAEQGVSQEASYFKSESETHATAANAWLTTTVVMTIVLAIMAACTLVMHKWVWLTPTTTYEAIQLAIGKVLLLGAVGSFAVVAARNYAANRHNAIVNKHRQNALLTYRSLVDAAGDEANRDIILQYAAHAIYFDQPTGFAKTDTSDGRSAPLVNFSNRGMGMADTGTGS